MVKSLQLQDTKVRFCRLIVCTHAFKIKHHPATQLISSVRMQKAKRLPSRVMNSITIIIAGGCTERRCNIDMLVTSQINEALVHLSISNTRFPSHRNNSFPLYPLLADVTKSQVGPHGTRLPQWDRVAETPRKQNCDINGIWVNPNNNIRVNITTASSDDNDTYKCSVRFTIFAQILTTSQTCP